MSLQDVEFIAKIAKEYSIQWIHYFKLGEPFLSPTISEEMKIIRRYRNYAMPAIATSTNGLVLDLKDKIEAALLMDHIYFSIDGINQGMVEKYQRRGNFERSYHNMANLVAERNLRGQKKPVIDWKYVVFNHNDRPSYIKQAIDLVWEAQVDMISFWQGGGSQDLVSHAFTNDEFFKTLGRLSWKGREIDFRLPDSDKSQYFDAVQRIYIRLLSATRRPVRFSILGRFTLQERRQFKTYIGGIYKFY